MVEKCRLMTGRCISWMEMVRREDVNLRTKSWGAVAVLLVLLLVVMSSVVLAGCGDDETTTDTTAADDTGTTESGDTETTEADTGDGETGDIPIGFLTSYTGELGAYGQMWFNAAQMAVDDVNAAGGVLDRDIKLYTEDSQTNVEEGIKAARKLINVNKVVAIAGPTSDVVVAIWPICKDNKVVVSSEAAGTTKLDKQGGDYQFRTVASDSFDGRAAARVLYEEEGFREIAVLYENDEGRRSIATEVMNSFKDLGGTISKEIAFAPQQATYSAELKQIADANPEAVWLGAGQESSIVLFKDASQRGYDWQWMVASDIAVEDIFDLIGADVLEGTLTEMPSADSEDENFQDWANRFQENFGMEATGGFQSNSYDQMIVLALAMEAAGEATGEGINANYREIASPPGEKVYTYAEAKKLLEEGTEIDYEGVSGPLDFDEYGNVAGSYAVLVARDGKWEEIDFYPASSFGVE